MRTWSAARFLDICAQEGDGINRQAPKFLRQRPSRSLATVDVHQGPGRQCDLKSGLTGQMAQRRNRRKNPHALASFLPIAASIRERKHRKISFRNLVWLAVRVERPQATCHELSAMSSETIPTEILYDILHLLCDGPIALHDLKNESHFHEFPWAVGQVCRHWRGAFLSYTRLWTSFTLKPGTFSAAYFAEMNRRATIYLERSGQQPLTIVASMPCSGTENFPKTVWKILLSCLKRWKKANLLLGNGAARDELLRCRGYMSSLESLTMSIHGDIAMKNYNAFQVGPQLTELDLAHPGYTAEWQFPWAQLTKLKIVASREELDNLWGVLCQLKNIEQLTIITTPYGPLFPSSLPMIHLPGLRRLEITLSFAMMFSWFTAPLLEHLHIHGHDHWNRYFRGHQPYERGITSLIQHTSCHIRRLALEKCRTDEMRRIVNALASVEELYLNHPWPDSLSIIQDVTGLDGCIYLPKLQVLQVTCNSVTVLESTVTVFSRLLEARGKGLSLASHDIVPLEKFVLRLTLRGKCPDEVLKVMHGWPSFAQIYINGSAFERLTPSL